MDVGCLGKMHVVFNVRSRSACGAIAKVCGIAPGAPIGGCTELLRSTMTNLLTDRDP